MVDSQPELSKEVLAIVDAVTVDGLKQRIGEKVYKMLAKLKKNNKQINESVINREDFEEVIVGINQKGLT